MVIDDGCLGLGIMEAVGISQWPVCSSVRVPSISSSGLLKGRHHVHNSAQHVGEAENEKFIEGNLTVTFKSFDDFEGAQFTHIFQQRVKSP
jgi:hypothetical protein